MVVLFIHVPKGTSLIMTLVSLNHERKYLTIVCFCTVHVSNALHNHNQDQPYLYHHHDTDSNVSDSESKLCTGLKIKILEEKIPYSYELLRRRIEDLTKLTRDRRSPPVMERKRFWLVLPTYAVLSLFEDIYTLS